MESEKAWLDKSQSQLTPEERLKAYAATGARITKGVNPGISTTNHEKIERTN